MLESLPFANREANGKLKVCVLLEAVIVKSVPLVEVANSCVPPVCVCPNGPIAVMPAPLVESVVPSNVRPLPTTSDLTAAVPLPVKIPPRVVEPVPPLATPSVPLSKLVLIDDVATTEPLAFVASRPLMMLVMANDVEVALPKVVLPKSALVKCDVDEANKPLTAYIGVEVADTVTP